MSTKQEIGERLRAERNRLGLAQADFGQRCGVTKTTQFNYEAGDRTPHAEYLAVADALGVDTHYVVTGRGVKAADQEFVVIPRHHVSASAGPGSVNGHDAEMHRYAILVGMAEEGTEARKTS